VQSRFETTRWSLVLAARTGQSAEGRKALAWLCEAYWYPIYAYVRRQGYAPEDARDLTQGYFARLLERGDLQDVDPALGRFRSFLLASVRHHLSNERDRERAKKRAPERPLLSLYADMAEDRYRVEPADAATPEMLFERKWASTVLERALARLREEWSGGERQRRFERLGGYLTGEEPAAPYAEAGRALGMTEESVRVAVHRLRRRLGDLLREEVAQTIRDVSDLDAEVRYVLGVLGPDNPMSL
jgi:RNA polymerase sigma-70 factor (ECF subfamily)